jgi:hypothetical protein
MRSRILGIKRNEYKALSPDTIKRIVAGWGTGARKPAPTQAAVAQAAVAKAPVAKAAVAKTAVGKAAPAKAARPKYVPYHKYVLGLQTERMVAIMQQSGK